MIRFTKPVLAALTLALCAMGATAHAATTPKTDTSATYNRLVDQVMARYHLPGLAVGVIKDGKVVYKRVIGKLPSGQPMNADTLFQIASNSKSMTVSLLARLVQQGKLRWDDPVTKYLPEFRMHDPWVTKNMQVGDLLAHHSGLSLGAGDLMLWPEPNHFTPKDVMLGLRYMKPAYSFRAGYHYDNTLYVVAGMVAAAAGGAPYPVLLRREVFQPLGMDRCQIGTWNREKVGNVSRPHLKRGDKFVMLPFHGSIVHEATMDAAGGVRCSLDGMLKWAMNWVAPTPQQLQWLDMKQRLSEWAIYTPMPISRIQREWDGTRFFGNGHGWHINDVDGTLTVWHTGSLTGMRSMVMLVPSLKSAFVVLLNSNDETARTVLDEVLLKQFTAPGKARSVASYADELARIHQRSRKRASSLIPDKASRHPATPQELKAQLGVWKDPWFGRVRICAEGDKVRFASLKSPLLTGQVMRTDKGGYLVNWAHGDADAWLRFPKQAGGILHMAKVDPDADFSYDYQDLVFTREHACE